MTQIMPVPAQKIITNLENLPSVFEGVTEQGIEESVSGASNFLDKQLMNGKTEPKRKKSDNETQSVLRRNEITTKKSASTMSHYMTQKSLQASIEQFVHDIGQTDKIDFDQLKEVDQMLRA